MEGLASRMCRTSFLKAHCRSVAQVERRSAVCAGRGGHNHSSGCAAALSLAVLLAAAVHPTAAVSREEKGLEPEGTGWVLAHHSFERTLTYEDRLGDWLTSAATMALRDRVQMLPPVSDRYGLFWNKRAVSTKNFEVTFNFRALPQKDAGPEDGVFAFWLSPDNFTASYDEQAVVTIRDWTKGLNDAGLNFISNRPKFKGIGVVFLSLDKGKSLRPSVSAVLSDASKEMKLSDFPENAQDTVLVAEAGGHQTKYIDWRQKEVECKIKVTPEKMVGSLKVGKDGSPEPLFEFFAADTKEIFSKPETFFGFSGWSGSPEPKPSSPLEFDINRVETRNFDKSQIGEDKQESQDLMDDEIGDTDGWKKVLEEEKRFIDQKSQSEAVERLTKLLGDYVDRYNKMGEKVKSDLVWLDKRMQTLDSEVSLLIGSSKAVNPETGEVEASSLKEHLKGIRSVLMKDKEVNDNKFHQVHVVAKELKAKGGDVLGSEGRAKVASVAEQVASVEERVNQGSSQTSSLLVVLILAVLALGLLFLNRMRYYEKKHYI